MLFVKSCIFGTNDAILISFKIYNAEILCTDSVQQWNHWLAKKKVFLPFLWPTNDTFITLSPFEKQIQANDKNTK